MEVYTLSKYNEMLANYFASSPKTVRGTTNLSFDYYKTMLFNKVLSIFKLDNTPDNWDVQYFFNILFTRGFIAITDTEVGPVALETGLAGINMYNQPTRLIITNPVLGSLDRTIHKDGVLVYMARIRESYLTLNHLIERYAVLLAQCDGTLNTTLMNSRVAHVFEAQNNADIKTLQKIYDDVSSGKPAVFVNTMGTQFTANNAFLNVKNTFIGNEILDVKRTIINEFLTEIGINNANTDKRERLNTDEVNANNNEIMCNIDVWLKQMQRGIDEANALFNLDLKLSLNYDVIGGANNGNEPNKYVGIE